MVMYETKFFLPPAEFFSLELLRKTFARSWQHCFSDHCYHREEENCIKKRCVVQLHHLLRDCKIRTVMQHTITYSLVSDVFF
jgi:hypothetical protein